MCSLACTELWVITTALQMTYSMQYLRQFCRPFQQGAATTRVFFPDKKASSSCGLLHRTVALSSTFVAQACRGQ